MTPDSKLGKEYIKIVYCHPAYLIHMLCTSREMLFSAVQSLSHVRLFGNTWIAAHQASLSITNSQGLLKLMPIESVMPSSHHIFCFPLLLLPPIPPTIRVFSNKSTLRMKWPKYCGFSFSISPSNEHPGRISFRMDWLDILAVQGTLKSPLQHHSSKASILRCSAFSTVQLSHPYMTTGQTIALTRWTFVGKVMSLLFNVLSRLVITFLPRSKGLLISWLQSPSAVILEPKKIKSDTVSTVFPSFCQEVISPSLFISLPVSAICKACSDSHFAFLHFFFLGMGFGHHFPYKVICLHHRSLGTLSTSSNPLNLFASPLCNHKIFDLGLVFFSTSFNLSLNFAIRSSWPKPQSTPDLIFTHCRELHHL